jgi:hypothetical protein
VPDTALWRAAKWLWARNAITRAATGVAGAFTAGRKSALSPALRDRITAPLLTPWMAPTGQQTAWSYFGKPLDAVPTVPGLLGEALCDWRWHDGHTTQALDYRGAARQRGRPPPLPL